MYARARRIIASFRSVCVWIDEIRLYIGIIYICVFCKGSIRYWVKINRKYSTYVNTFKLLKKKKPRTRTI